MEPTTIVIPPASARGREGEAVAATDLDEVLALVHPDDVSVARTLVARGVASPGVRFTDAMRVLHPADLGAHHAALVHVTWRPDDPGLAGLTLRIEAGADGTPSTSDSSPGGWLALAPTGELIGGSDHGIALLDGAGPAADPLADWLERLRVEDRHLVEAVRRGASAGRFGPPIEVGTIGADPVAWLRLTFLPLHLDDGASGGSLVRLLDITDEYEARLAMERARAELLHQARHDALTGLNNRIPFLEELSIALTTSAVSERRRRRADGEHRCAVLVCDLDGFKAVNDTFGHHRGDAVLREVARRLERVVRAEDTLCRYGGDEFLVLCTDVSPDRLHELASRVVDAVAADLVIDGDEHAVGMSVGVALAEPGDERDPDELIRRADRAMYRAKAAGGRRAEVADGEPSSSGLDGRTADRH